MGQGSCSIIEHDSDRTTVIDVCNARPSGSRGLTLAKEASALDRGIGGNFHQKDHPVNPISYMKERQISDIFRYVQTHPDMDHMDGIEAFFDAFSPTNFWDTDNTKEMDSGWSGSPYRETDWKFYKRLRDNKPEAGPKRLTLHSGAKGPYYNQGENGAAGGDDLHILAPTRELVNAANKADQDYNGCSYVLLYVTKHKRKIVFAGDSHDETWEHILKNHEDYVTDVDLLIAPHHGRASGRSYEFLDALTPTLTFFGNASSEHLAYGAWRNRNLRIITNNQANCMIVDTAAEPMNLYVTNEVFARRINPNTYPEPSSGGWYVCGIT